MERTLSLVLDNYQINRVSLTLMKADAHDIDKFTTRFESSEEIREYFQKDIEAYLESNKNSNSRNRGDICVLEAVEKDHSLVIERRKVLYKKHIATHKKILYNPEVMRHFIVLSSERAKRFQVVDFTSGFVKKVIKDYGIKTAADKGAMNKWLSKKTSEMYYEKIRYMVKAYEEVAKRLKEKNIRVKSIDELYRDWLQEKAEKKEIRLQKDGQRKLHCLEDLPESSFEIINGMRYYVEDKESIPFDLDDLTNAETTYYPDGIGRKK